MGSEICLCCQCRWEASHQRGPSQADDLSSALRSWLPCACVVRVTASMVSQPRDQSSCSNLCRRTSAWPLIYEVLRDVRRHSASANNDAESAGAPSGGQAEQVQLLGHAGMVLRDPATFHLIIHQVRLLLVTPC